MAFRYSNRNQRYGYKQQLEQAETIPDIFEIVKSAVRTVLGKDHAGLILGLTVLPAEKGFHVGAYYSFYTNTILMNKIPLQRIKNTNPKLYNPYIFHMLLYEYLKSIGFYDEDVTQQLTYEISRKCFGSRHIVTKIAQDIGRFFNDVAYSETGFLPKRLFPIEYVSGFDKSSQYYIG